ncbi:MAG: FAD-dependent oxidoreductase [Cyclobacteriaceae bacterium]|nr:FAD-dependent oxidoreductase [Cyclobacteriaceae bacterium]
MLPKYILLVLIVFIVFAKCSKPNEPVIEADICVYGGTSSGVIAAYAAKLQGKSVILIEPGKHLGGMSSGGLGQTDIGNKQAITGLARQFYRDIGRHYGKDEQWVFEPHVAEKIFLDYIRNEEIDVLFSFRLATLNKIGDRLATITVEPSNGTSNNKIIRAKMFIDCSYEGDLMAKTGVSYTVGREPNRLYNETFNGVQLKDKHQFRDGIDPYVIPGNPKSGLIWGVMPDSLFSEGSGDKKLQAYNFRLCLTNQPENRIDITRPADYDSIKYELLIRQLATYTPDSLNWQLLHIASMPNHKTDINNCGGFSSDMVGMNYEYPEGDYETRDQIVKAHESYTKGWLYFIGHDPRVPAHLRNEMLEWGFPKDEYVDNDHFTPQLYIREARRMISDYVMTQHNCQGREKVEDGIGLAAYTMDSHNCQRIVVNGMVKNEGDVQEGGFGPYPISFRSIVPKKGECSNLVVPVCLSASHIAYGSIRMEPVFMVLGQSAAMAACLAIDSETSIQEIDVRKLQVLLKN